MTRSLPALTRNGLLGLACALAVVLVACRDAEPEPVPPAGGPSWGLAVVVLRDVQFQPSPLQISTGTIVTWVNHDASLHTVTSGVPSAADGRFHGRLDGRERAYQFTFVEPGTYAYFCSLHPAMPGEVRVQ